MCKSSELSVIGASVVLPSESAPWISLKLFRGRGEMHAVACCFKRPDFSSVVKELCVAFQFQRRRELCIPPRNWNIRKLSWYVERCWGFPYLKSSLVSWLFGFLVSCFLLFWVPWFLGFLVSGFQKSNQCFVGR